MQKFVFLMFLVTIGYAVGELTPAKYKHIKVDDVLRNTRLLKRYVDCCLGEQTACSNEGSFLAEILPKAIKTNCKECSDKEKEGALKVIAFLQKHHNDWWVKLDTKYQAAESDFCIDNAQKIKELKKTL